MAVCKQSGYGNDGDYDGNSSALSDKDENGSGDSNDYGIEKDDDDGNNSGNNNRGNNSGNVNKISIS